MQRFIISFTLWVFITSTLGPIPQAQADEFILPAVGAMVSTSPKFNPPLLKGIKVDPENPFKLEFILDRGDENSLQHANTIKIEAVRLIKYFLASLTTPEKDLWVNLSPYEKNRIIPQSFGQTQMGRDLLAEDYILKQITASLIYPEGETGKKFWKTVYEKAARKFGTTDIRVKTFNKVWIIPDRAMIYESVKAKTAYVVDAKLKVMLQEDYLAMQNNSRNESSLKASAAVTDIGSDVLRQIVIPELDQEINEGQNFIQLRQVYHALILAAWYKKKIRNSILAQFYEDKKKVYGMLSSPGYFAGNTEGIYQRYLQSFKKGVYNYIKEEQDPITRQEIPRKYFSGGMFLALTGKDANKLVETQNAAMITRLDRKIFVRLTVFLKSIAVNGVQLIKKWPFRKQTPQVSRFTEEEQIAMLRNILKVWSATEIPVEKSLKILWAKLQKEENEKLNGDFKEKVLDPWETLGIKSYLNGLPRKKTEEYKPSDFEKFFMTAKVGVSSIRANLLSLMDKYAVSQDEESVKDLIHSIDMLVKFMLDPVAMGLGEVHPKEVDLNLLIGDNTLVPYLLEEQRAQELAHEWKNHVQIVQGLSRLVSRMSSKSEDKSLKEFNSDLQVLCENFEKEYKDFESIRDPDALNAYFNKTNIIVTEMVERLEKYKGDFAKQGFRENVEAGLRAILDYIKNRDNPIVFEFKDLNRIVDGSYIFYTSDSRIKISTDYSNQVINAYVDPVKFGQVIKNIVKNAIEAIQETKKPGTVVIATRIEEGKIKITISDDGPGMPQDIQSEIFQKRHRSTKSEDRSTNGIGMGIVKQIIESHGGNISFKSELGKGTTFTILLPLIESTAVHSSRAMLTRIGRPSDLIKQTIVPIFVSVRDNPIEGLYETASGKASLNGLYDLITYFKLLEFGNSGIKVIIDTEYRDQFGRLMQLLSENIPDRILNKKSVYETIEKLKNSNLISERVAEWLNEILNSKDFKGKRITRKTFFEKIAELEHEFYFYFLSSIVIYCEQRLEDENGPMTRERALAILGLKSGYTLNQAKEIFGKLLWRFNLGKPNHPWDADYELMRARKAYETLLGDSAQIAELKHPKVNDELNASNTAAMGKKGGIDLNPAYLNLQAQVGDSRDGDGIKFQFDPAQLSQFQHASGFIPVGIVIQPLGDLRNFLENPSS